MYFVYILKSQKFGRHYIGYTNNVQDRIKHHNSGANKSTRPYIPWELIHHEEFITKQDAWLREKQIKSYKGGVAFKKLIGNHGEVA